MPPIDPRVVKAKRFPAHAAVAVCCMEEIKRLLIEDAPFHVVRKVPDIEISVLHSACSTRHRHGAPKTIFSDLVKYLIQVCLLIVHGLLELWTEIFFPNEINVILFPIIVFMAD